MPDDPKPAAPTLKLWMLSAKDRQETPFYHSAQPHTVLVTAMSEIQARRFAIEAYGEHWGDLGLSACAEFKTGETGIVATAGG